MPAPPPVSHAAGATLCLPGCCRCWPPLPGPTSPGTVVAAVMPAPSFLERSPLVPVENHISLAAAAAALEKCSVKQAGVVLPGRGGGTRLGSQPCSSRLGNAGNAGEVEEEEGRSQQPGHRLSRANPLACGTGRRNSVKMMVATRQSLGGDLGSEEEPLNSPTSSLQRGLNTPLAERSFFHEVLPREGPSLHRPSQSRRACQGAGSGLRCSTGTCSQNV